MRSPALIVPAVSEYLYPRTEEALRVYQLTPPQRWREERTRVRQQRYQGERRPPRGAIVRIFHGRQRRRRLYGRRVPARICRRRLHRRSGGQPRPAGHTDAQGTRPLRPSRPRPGVEFLASTDVWFRPCNFINAPDGNLYMLDFYREVIESPEYIPDAIKKFIDFHRGDDKGASTASCPIIRNGAAT